MRGKLIALCGIDGCGKTTQEKLLESYLNKKGYETLITKQPTDFYRNNEIVKNYFKLGKISNMKCLALLAAADRQFHLSSVIFPNIEAGKFVITNRYVYSTYAYFMARNVDLDFLRAINPDILIPDLTILFDLPASVASERVNLRDGNKKWEEKNICFMEEVRLNFLKNIDKSFLKIDATIDKMEIHELIVNEINNRTLI